MKYYEIFFIKIMYKLGDIRNFVISKMIVINREYNIIVLLKVSNRGG